MRLILFLLFAACGGSSAMDAGTDAGMPPVDLGGDSPDARRPVDLGVDATLPPLDYTDPSLWLCRPGRSDDCNTHDLTATEIFPDGGTQLDTYEYDGGTPAPTVDCFYVYPTVDVSGVPGNHTDLTDTANIVEALLTQVVRLGTSCRLWVPLYREATFGTFAALDGRAWIDAAYLDVKAAFDEYLAHLSMGHDFVLLGHSQGSFHLRHLIQDEIDGDPTLRSRLVAAVLLGGDVVVPDGATVGGSFQHVPLCTSESERGCVVQWRTYFESAPPPGTSFFSRLGTVPMGDDVACSGVFPNDGGVAPLEGSYLPTAPTFQSGLGLPAPTGVTTPFLLYRALWDARCERQPGGTSYLGIAQPATDTRMPPLHDSDPLFFPSLLGLHVLDYPIAEGDVVRMVRAKIAAP